MAWDQPEKGNTLYYFTLVFLFPLLSTLLQQNKFNRCSLHTHEHRHELLEGKQRFWISLKRIDYLYYNSTQYHRTLVKQYTQNIQSKTELTSTCSRIIQHAAREPVELRVKHNGLDQNIKTWYIGSNKYKQTLHISNTLFA